MTIRYDQTESVLWVTLNRPRKRNAFDGQMMAELTRVFAEPPEGAHVLVLTGAGSVFCAGADLAWMAENTTREDSLLIARFFRAVRMCPRPVVAKVNGPAIGGGVGLVACCDVAVASREAFFQLSEVLVGILPAVISPYVAEKVGVGRLRDWMVTGRRIQAETAQAWGLVSEVVEPGTLDEAASGYVEQLLKGSVEAQAAAKRLAAELAGLTREGLLEDTVDIVTRLRGSPEAKRRMAAFLHRKRGGRS